MLKIICGTLALALTGAGLAFEAFSGEKADVPAASEPIQPLPLSVDFDLAKARLGRELFSDARLSADNSVSCASCHGLGLGGADGRQFSVGIGGALGDINAPTIFNSGFNYRQFWNGRAATLEDQLDGPVQHAKEMGSRWEEVVAKLRADKALAAGFSAAYPEGISVATIKDAISTFERALFTPNAPIDRFLRGDALALNAQEKRGYVKFKAYGCVSCHQGVNVGGNMFQTMGVMGNYFKDRKGPVRDADLGRFLATKKDSDKHVFRVPSLRNVALTAPYFHDGSARTLSEAVKVMARYQLGRELSQSDEADLVKFLGTLTGDRPAILSETERKTP